MTQYINKDVLVAEIESLRRTTFTNFDEGVNAAVQTLLEIIDTLEVKDANEALRTEYEKGRYDVIGKTLKWLWDLNQEHEIMSYTDSHVLDSEELQKYYKNNIEE